ncbi:MAG TPA: putative porin [Verrucomicrobiae bacterium]
MTTKLKNSRKSFLSSGTTIMTGTALLASLAAAQADVSGDALINKLVQKGVLTVDEGKQLRVENQQDFTNNVHNSFAELTGMPNWVTGYRLSGDVRGRFDNMTSDNSLFVDRTRLRYRVRVGLAVTMQDGLEAGVRLASGDYPGSFGGNPLSANTTMQDNFSRKSIFVDAAYGKWKFLNTDDLVTTAIVGKMDNPFNFTPMVFDADLTPEGAALTGNYNINAKQSLAWTAGAFVLDEEKALTRDPFMYGGQISWNAKWTPKLASSLSAGAFDISAPEMLTAANVGAWGQGNTRKANGQLKYKYDPVIGDASVTYTLDSFPLYPGKFPIKLQAEYMNNPGAARNNNAWWVGGTLGKVGKKHSWDISYRYEYLESDAWYDQLVDDDFVAYYAVAPVAGSAGLMGGTNMKGHLVKFNYAITDSLVFSTTAYIDDLIDESRIKNIKQPSGAIHFMADVMWKF